MKSDQHSPHPLFEKELSQWCGQLVDSLVAGFQRLQLETSYIQNSHIVQVCVCVYDVYLLYKLLCIFAVV